MWQAKATAQNVLARLTGRGGGEGDSISARVDEMGGLIDRMKVHHPIAGATVAVIGTGGDALPALCLSAEGAERVYAFDHIRHLRLEGAQIAAKAAAQARPEWETLWPVSAADSLRRLLHLARVDYAAPRDVGRTGLRPASVDIFFSYAAPADINKPMAEAVIAEARRVLKPSGIFYGRK